MLRSKPIWFTLTLVSTPGKRRAALEVAREIERRGFEGVTCSQSGAGIAVCHSLAHVTDTLRFATGIVNIYARNPVELSQAACYIHELAPGRFTLGLGVSHQPFNEEIGVTPGSPTADMRRFVERLKASGPSFGGLPPIHLAALRRRMMTLAGQIANGVCMANVPLSRVAEVIAPIPPERCAAGFYRSNIIPICVSDDRRAAIAALKQRMLTYVVLPNYMNFWREYGYQDMIDRIERAYRDGGPPEAVEAMDEHWLADVTIFGTAREVRERVAAWQATGVTPVLGPVSVTGDHFKAFEEVMNVLA